MASAARGVDIFAAKYVLVPIHDTGHWSLLILCFLKEDSWDAAARTSGCYRRATLIHLDSLRRALASQCSCKRCGVLHPGATLVEG